MAELHYEMVDLWKRKIEKITIEFLRMKFDLHLSQSVSQHDLFECYEMMIAASKPEKYS